MTTSVRKNKATACDAYGSTKGNPWQPVDANTSNRKQGFGLVADKRQQERSSYWRCCAKAPREECPAERSGHRDESSRAERTRRHERLQQQIVGGGVLDRRPKPRLRKQLPIGDRGRRHVVWSPPDKGARKECLPRSGVNRDAVVYRLSLADRTDQSASHGGREEQQPCRQDKPNESERQRSYGYPTACSPIHQHCGDGDRENRHKKCARPAETAS